MILALGDINLWTAFIGGLSGLLTAVGAFNQFMQKQKKELIERAKLQQNVDRDIQSLRQYIEETRTMAKELEITLDKRNLVISQRLESLDTKLDKRFDQLNQTIIEFLQNQNRQQ